MDPSTAAPEWSALGPPSPSNAESSSAAGNDQCQHPEEQPQPHPSPEDARKYVRQCWICLEEVEPTYDEPGLLDSIQNKPRKRRYVSEDYGRLINPCRCKGTVKYVHEDCLKQWMNESPDAFTCGRCGYVYRMERLTWAQKVKSPIAAFAITIAILVGAVFLLGFVADPILGLWLDPVGTITETVTSSGAIMDEGIEYDEEEGWVEHFLKGIFSLGLLGFVKAFLAMSPFQWWNLRTTGIVGGGGVRRAGTGRDRMENINLALVVIGVFTFLYAVWKTTKKWADRALERASQRILNVQGDNDDDDDDNSDDEEDGENGEDKKDQ